MIEKIKKLIGKRIFIQISGDRMYNGILNEVSDTFLEMTDKFGESVFIAISEIKFIQEKK